jgi:hypothetical protein
MSSTSSQRDRKSNLYGFNLFPSTALARFPLSLFGATDAFRQFAHWVAFATSEFKSDFDLASFLTDTRGVILTPAALRSKCEDLVNLAENPLIFKVYDCIGDWYYTILRPLFPLAISLVRLFLSMLFWPFFLSA